MKKAITALLAITSLGAQAVDHDKKLHFAVSATIGAVSQHVIDDQSISLAACLSVGLAKELYDQYSYGGFDAKDMTANAIGCAVGIATYDYAIKPVINYDYAGIEYKFKF